MSEREVALMTNSKVMWPDSAALIWLSAQCFGFSSVYSLDLLSPPSFSDTSRQNIAECNLRDITIKKLSESE